MHLPQDCFGLARAGSAGKAVGVFDVVEHIEEDVAFLRHLWDLLEPGGMLYLTVPAYQFLWSHEDVLAGHFRRYTVKGMGKKLQEAGFDLTFGTYVFRFLPLFVFCFRTLPFRLGLASPKVDSQRAARDHAARDHAATPGLTSSLFQKLLQPELSNIKRRKPMLFGGSCLMAARKPTH